MVNIRENIKNVLENKSKNNMLFLFVDDISEQVDDYVSTETHETITKLAFFEIKAKIDKDLEALMCSEQ